MQCHCDVEAGGRESAAVESAPQWFSTVLFVHLRRLTLAKAQHFRDRHEEKLLVHTQLCELGERHSQHWVALKLDRRCRATHLLDIGGPSQAVSCKTIHSKGTITCKLTRYG